MYKRLLFAALLCTTVPLPANAGFLAPVVAVALPTIGGWLAGGGIVGFLTATGLSFLTSAISTKLLGDKQQGQQDIFRELSEPKSLPVYRFVYGQGWAAGTPAPIRVKENRIYACFILNSRPSEGPFTVYLDKRKVVATGDPYDFQGYGADATEGLIGGHCRYWIGRGDQSGPPKYFLDTAPEFFKATDSWKGRTVLWATFKAGRADEFQDRWPSAPPEVFVEGKWTKVWDPRDPAQDPNNEATWKFSRNYSLCALDALRMNPVRPYPLTHLWIDMFKWAANVADQPLQTKIGTTIPKFRSDGTMTFSEGSEIEDLVAPILAAGAGRWIRSSGKLGILPAVAQEPVGVIDSVLDKETFVFERWRASDELYTEAFAKFISPDRAYETATSPTYKIQGAEAEDLTGPRPLELDLGFVQDFRQAQYVCKIELWRTRMQRSTQLTAPPEAFNFLAGANVTLNLPAPFQLRNGLYKIEECSPASDPLGTDGSVGLAIPMTLREDRASNYSWNPATEEQAMPVEELDTGFVPVPAPANITVQSGSPVAITSGNSILPRIEYVFPKGTDARVRTFRVDIREESEGAPWILVKDKIPIEEDVGAFIQDYSGVLTEGKDFRVRVRAETAKSVSGWTVSQVIRSSAGVSSAPPPTPLDVTRVANGLNVRFRSPNSVEFDTVEILQSSSPNPASATRLFGNIRVDPNTVITRLHSGMPSGATRYYWARATDHRGLVSGFSEMMSGTYTA